MDAKAGAQEKFKTIEQHLLGLSHRIHAHPELGFQEEKACVWGRRSRPAARWPA